MEIKGVEVGSLADLLTGIGTIGLMLAALSATRTWKWEAVGRRRMKTAEQALIYLRNIESNLVQLSVVIETMINRNLSGQTHENIESNLQQRILDLVIMKQDNFDSLAVEVDIVFGQRGLSIIEDAALCFSSLCSEAVHIALHLDEESDRQLPQRIEREVEALRKRADKFFLRVIRDGN